MSAESAIRNVADTALWMASIRAVESDRHDAVFHDPLAAMLAGERGRAIVGSMPGSAAVTWTVIVRTTAIDRLIETALHGGVDMVINLGAGMDTRPYRMDLPSHIRWIEIDSPAIVEMKNAHLQGHTAACSVERVGLDLSDAPSRRKLFARYGAASKRVLLIAEGLIPYFSAIDVASLVNDVFAIPSFCCWILDFDNAGIRRTPRSWSARLKAAPFLFEVKDWFHFFDHLGWAPQTVITSAEESERINRPFPFSFPRGLIMHMLPADMRRKVLSASGAVLLARR